MVTTAAHSACLMAPASDRGVRHWEKGFREIQNFGCECESGRLSSDYETC